MLSAQKKVVLGDVKIAEETHELERAKREASPEVVTTARKDHSFDAPLENKKLSRFLRLKD